MTGITLPNFVVAPLLTLVFGVYLSWRGKSTEVGLLQPLTFYSRRGAGQRAASVSTTEAILRVMLPTASGGIFGVMGALVGLLLRKQLQICWRAENRFRKNL